jgi:hypothetical protein
MQRLFYLVFFSILFVSACRENIGEQFGSNSSEFTSEEQSTLGKSILSNMQSRPDKFPFLDSDQYADAYNYLQDTILAPLIYGSALRNRIDFDWQVFIIADDAIDNAFALPGGQLVIYSGLLKYLEGNDEITAVLAHEIAYTDQDRIIEKLTRRFDRFSLNAMANGQLTEDTEQVADYFKSLVYLQKDVLYADSIATNLVCPFNYKSSALLEVLNRAYDNNDRIDWIEKRDAETSTRKQALLTLLSENPECSEGEQLEMKAAYNRFKTNYLP